jgi:hypothetical protein
MAVLPNNLQVKQVKPLFIPAKVINNYFMQE